MFTQIFHKYVSSHPFPRTDLPLPRIPWRGCPGHYSEGLWQEIDAFTQTLRASETADSIKQQPAIAATREAYRRLGKDPSRYRPSAEALRRRLLRGLELYKIDTLVDLINLVSLRTGYSIGGFDADKIQGTRFRARTFAWA